MNRLRSVADIFAILVGLFLVVEGIWGLTSHVVFAVLTTNETHAIIHLALGILGIITGAIGRARGFCIFLGILLLAVGILRFIPVTGDFIVRVLNVNIAVACLNIIVGGIALIVSATQPSPRSTGSVIGSNFTPGRERR
jgi:hypothetical protein